MSQPQPTVLAPSKLPAPLAPRRPVVHEAFGLTREDPWSWLRERDNPEVLAHLNAENAYTAAALAPYEALSTEVLDEIKARVVQSDTSVPSPYHRFAYYTRTVEGLAYPIRCRRPLEGGEEEVLLDQNQLAQGQEYCALGTFALSLDETQLLYSLDVTGAEVYELRVRALEGARAGQEDVVATSVAGGGGFVTNDTVVFLRQDAAMRPHEAWAQVLGQEPTLLVREDDESFFLGVELSDDEQWVVCSSHSKETSEQWLIPARDLAATPRSVMGRRLGVQYYCSPHTPRNELFLLTNASAPDFELWSQRALDGEAPWETRIAAEPGVRIDEVLVLQDYVVCAERANASTRLRVYGLDSRTLSTLGAPEEVAVMGLATNLLFDAHEVRYTYESLATPLTVMRVELLEGEQLVGEPEVLKVQPMGATFDAGAYVTERLWIQSADDTRVPVSLVRRRDTDPFSAPPALVYAYGSYEISIDPWFNPTRISLLDRGAVYLIVHARGGGELGRAWYDGGKLANKPRTFEDVAAAVEQLQGEQRIGAAVLRGGSAGGLMVGAVLNLIPGRLAGAVAEVPFVDCTNTMLDDTLPLTITEYEEWGSPLTPEGFGWLTSYAPYDNVADASFPPVLATAGLNDPRVGYWEPAKWVQRLREHQRGEAPILLLTELGAGHGGPSGRYDAWTKESRTLAFILACLGLASPAATARV